VARSSRRKDRQHTYGIWTLVQSASISRPPQQLVAARRDKTRVSSTSPGIVVYQNVARHNINRVGLEALTKLRAWGTVPCTAELLTSLETENINIYSPFGNPLETGNINIYIYYIHLYRQ
jgi:hypothetical protein